VRPRPVLLAAAAAASLGATVAAPPAAAVPPHVLSGSGTISPGLDAEPSDQWIAYDGTPWIVGSDWCHLSGPGHGTAAGVTGTVSGSCGTTTYDGCPFTLTAASWTVACPGSVGVFHVRFLNALPTTVFAADGAMA
jgi:FtsP/CotA-like multicopper oxidase with cupredoxin domain